MRRNRVRRGVALIMVLVLIVMISLGAYTFANLMTAQERATIVAGRRVQAEAAVASGVEYIKDYLALLPEDQAGLGGHWDNPAYFQDVFVSDDADGATRFSIVSIIQDQYGEPTGLRFGIEDEGSKININTLAAPESSESGTQGSDDAGTEASGSVGEEEGGEGEGEGREGGEESGGGVVAFSSDVGGTDGDTDSETEEDPLADPKRDALMALPGMTETIADSILDWIDSDSITRDFGAEGDMYSAVVGYVPPDGPISSLDELLLVQGVTNELLYGADRNHNGIIDATEQEIASALGGANGSMARGWSAYLTITSKDLPVESELEPIDLNQEDMEALFDEVVAAGFEEDFASYIVAYRQSGPYSMPEIPDDAPDDFELPTPVAVEGRQPDLSQPGKQKLTSVLDLLGSSVQGNFVGGQDGKTESVLVASPYGDGSDLSSVLPQMMSNFAVGEAGGTGRINLNHCSSPVASGLPGMDLSIVQSILLAQDPSGLSGDPNYLYPTWPLAKGAVTVEQMKALLPYVSGNGAIFRAQVVGYSDVPGTFARAEVVIDASGDAPRVLSWRDLTHLGPGFTLDSLMSQ